MTPHQADTIDRNRASPGGTGSTSAGRPKLTQIQLAEVDRLPISDTFALRDLDEGYRPRQRIAGTCRRLEVSADELLGLKRSQDRAAKEMTTTEAIVEEVSITSQTSRKDQRASFAMGQIVELKPAS